MGRHLRRAVPLLVPDRASRRWPVSRRLARPAQKTAPHTLTGGGA